MSDIEKIKQLRQSTSAGFKDCSAALKESNGNIDKAVEILRIKGISKASKKMSREAKEGVIALSGNHSKTSVIEVNCETDFVAKNEDFIIFVKELSEINDKVNSDTEKLKTSLMKNQKSVEDNLVAMIAKIGEKITLGRTKTIFHENSKNYFYMHTVVKDNLSKLAVVASIKTKGKFEKIDLFGKQLTMHIAASNPLAIESEELNKEILLKEQELISEELKNSGKPEDIAKKISIGKLSKFKEENSLMTQQWVMEPKKKVKDVIQELTVSDIKIVDFYRIKIGD
jgi:elongation factor Ts